MNPATIRSVQSALNIPADGQAGNQTWTAIYVRLLDVTAAQVTLSISDMIEAVQQALGLTVDGVAGNQTWTAIAGALVPATAVTPAPTQPAASGVIGLGYPVIDINHYNDPLDLDRCWNDGVRIIWHKGSQGDQFKDPLYAARKKAALAKGFKWGIYHFSGGQSAQSQLDNLFDVEDGNDQTIAYALDWEHSTDGTNDMTLDQARTFLQGLKDRTGDYGWVYGSDLLRESLSGPPDAIVGQARLWLADYSVRPAPAPATWPNGYSLLQTGQQNFAGIAGCDLNVPWSNCSDDAFVAGWPFRAAA